MMPGTALHRLAARICSRKSLERVVEPAIADLQKEYGAASRLSDRGWVLLTGYFAILKAIAVCAAIVPATTSDERRALSMTFAWSLGWIAAISALLILPPLFNHSINGWRAAMTLVPQAIPLSIPIGIAFGIAFSLSARPVMTVAKVTLLGAVAASALSFAILAWGMPAANQAFREMSFRTLRARGYQGHSDGLQKGPNEMTLSELRSQEAYFLADGQPRQARRFAFSFHLRFALAAATLALVSVLLAAPVNHRGWRGAVAFGACFTYWILLYVCDLGSRSGYLPVPIAAWLPNLGLMAFAVVVASSRLRGSMDTVR